MMKNLSTGDKICIVAPGRKVSPFEMEVSISVFESWGLEVILGEHLFSQQHSYLSGTDQERINDFQNAIDNPEIKAIICARGGYGSSRIIDALDFSRLKKNPKWIVGFSDITCFHLVCSSMGIPSLHGAMPIQFVKEEAKKSIASLRSALFEAPEKIESSPNVKNRLGIVTAPIMGGNLSLLVDSLGTQYEINTDHKILLIEEIDEPRYKIDRMLMQLKRAGKFNNLSGLGIGQMTEIGDSTLPFEESVEEIVLSKVPKEIPVAFNLPFGHEHPNVAWIQGRTSKFEVQQSDACIS